METGRRFLKGKFYGLGVGPGDPELITLKAYKILKEVNVLYAPRSSVDRDSLALQSVVKLTGREYERLELLFPMTMDRKTLEESWSEAGERIAQEVHRGRTVAFVTIGDPMFYSTYGYVLKYLQTHHPDVLTETVPGVMAMSACASMHGLPLTEGEESVVVMPAVYGLSDLEETIKKFDNVVLLKVHKKIEEVSGILEKLGMKGKAMFFSRCGYSDQFQTADLDSLRGVNLDYMSLLIIQKRGFDRKPLTEKGVIPR